jgi:hypothetical protein
MLKIVERKKKEAKRKKALRVVQISEAIQGAEWPRDQALSVLWVAEAKGQEAVEEHPKGGMRAKPEIHLRGVSGKEHRYTEDFHHSPPICEIYWSHA